MAKPTVAQVDDRLSDLCAEVVKLATLTADLGDQLVKRLVDLEQEVADLRRDVDNLKE